MLSKAMGKKNKKKDEQQPATNILTDKDRLTILGCICSNLKTQLQACDEAIGKCHPHKL